MPRTLRWRHKDEATGQNVLCEMKTGDWNHFEYFEEAEPFYEGIFFPDTDDYTKIPFHLRSSYHSQQMYTILCCMLSELEGTSEEEVPFNADDYVWPHQEALSE
jgi:hypothetical protein